MSRNHFLKIMTTNRSPFALKWNMYREGIVESKRYETVDSNIKFTERLIHIHLFLTLFYKRFMLLKSKSTKFEYMGGEGFKAKDWYKEREESNSTSR